MLYFVHEILDPIQRLSLIHQVTFGLDRSVKWAYTPMLLLLVHANLYDLL